MIDRPPREPDSPPEPRSPRVHIQDVEHDARPETRVNDAGVEVKPRPRKAGEEESAPEGDHEKAHQAESTFQADLVKLPAD